jgi:hypothetical protein
MKKLLFPVAALALCMQHAFAGEYPILGGKKTKPKKNLLREVPDAFIVKEQAADSAAPEPEFKPSFQVGAIVHMIGSVAQVGYPGSNTSTPTVQYPKTGDPADWVTGAMIYRGRILVGGQLSKKGSFFLETELPHPIGGSGDTSNKGGKYAFAPIMMLDCQYEHKFSEKFQVVAGAQLTSGNRNGLQGAASLMANDFTFYQYAYNTFPSQPLKSNFGRDVGINFRGYLLNDRLEYRLGWFLGRHQNGKDPLRTVGRLVYNFLDKDKSFYYSGTNLGKGKTISLGGGIDMQADYLNVGPDLFVDVPLGSPGSITFNGAFQYLTGGSTDPTKSTITYSQQIPNSTVQFAELGYYFKDLKIQPWLRYENFMVSATDIQRGATSSDVFNKTHSSMVFGGGINYFFNGYGTNLRLSYVTKTQGVVNSSGGVDTKAYGQAWLQLQFFLF